MITGAHCTVLLLVVVCFTHQGRCTERQSGSLNMQFIYIHDISSDMMLFITALLSYTMGGMYIMEADLGRE